MPKKDKLERYETYYGHRDIVLVCEHYHGACYWIEEPKDGTFHAGNTEEIGSTRIVRLELGNGLRVRHHIKSEHHVLLLNTTNKKLLIMDQSNVINHVSFGNYALKPGRFTRLETDNAFIEYYPEKSKA